MKLKTVIAAVAVLIGTSGALATTLDLGSAWLDYDGSTVLGSANAVTTGAGVVSFSWSLNTTLGVASFGEQSSSASKEVLFPSFMITVKPGFVLSGPVSATLGELRYQENATSSTAASVQYKVSSSAFPTVTQAFSLTKTPSTSFGGVTFGAYTGADSSPSDPFTVYVAQDVKLSLSAFGPNAVIFSDNLSKLQISFNATPVPEPETYAMLLAGVGVVGWVARRRRQA